MTWEALEAGRSQGLESWVKRVICPQHSPEGLRLFHLWRGEWPDKAQINVRALDGSRVWQSRCCHSWHPADSDILCPPSPQRLHRSRNLAQLGLRAGAWERHRSEAFSAGG